MRIRFWFGVVLAAVVAVAGVQGIAQATSVTDVKRYTAAEYFDGIFFGTGPVADRLPQLYDDRSAKDEVAAAETAAALRAQIEADSPRFVSHFAATVVSGDRVAIRDVLVEGMEKLSEAYGVVYPGGTDAVPASPCNFAGCTIAIAIAVVVWVAFWVTEWAWSGMQPYAEADLYLDQVVEAIATELALR